MSLENKVILITGATKGIGNGIARHFASLGSRVILGYRSSEDEAKAVTQIIQKETNNKEVYYERIDVSNYEKVLEKFNEIVGKFGAIDILVNNAGVSYGGALLPSNDVKQWGEIIDTNIIGTINCITAVSLHMLLNKKGSIVNVSSVAGIKGVERLSAYSASKAGVIGLTRSLGKEFAPFNVRVNSIAPGFIEETGMVNQIPLKQMEGFKKDIAMNRLGTVEEIANTVEFLASDKASYITGQTIVVDGGFS